MRNDSDFIDNFIGTFEKLGDLWTSYELDPIAWQLASGNVNEYGFKEWRPIRVSTERSSLEALYASLPARSFMRGKSSQTRPDLNLPIP